jgi:hypothetical protein
MPLLQLLLTVPGGAICWAIGRFACKSRYDMWELAGPALPTLTYLFCMAIFGVDGKSEINSLDEPFYATSAYLLSMLLRSIIPQQNHKLGRALAVGVFVAAIATGVAVYLTTGSRKL